MEIGYTEKADAPGPVDTRGAPEYKTRGCGMKEAVPFLIPIVVFFIIGLVTRIASVREMTRYEQQQDHSRK